MAFFLTQRIVPMTNHSNHTADYLFIGMGAANCLLLLQMHEHGLLRDKRITLIEPNEGEIVGRNFCFWATEEELNKLGLGALVSSTWSNIKVAEREIQAIAPLSYFHINGSALHRKAQDVLQQYDVKKYRQAYHGEPLCSSDSCLISLDEKTLEAHKIFDSRPPKYDFSEKHKVHLLQSFCGWEVQTEGYDFDGTAMVMMDFEIPQNDSCQFIYILPFAKDRALFEVTRFGRERISKEEAETILVERLNQIGCSYKIVDHEFGVIPMSSHTMDSHAYDANWIATGAKAHMIKPTTGYAFHNMAIDAHNLVDAMIHHRPYQRKSKPQRFAYYDHLLLAILDKTPENGKRIFAQLFKHISITDVLHFLNERSTVRKEIQIFSKLPIRLFLKAACKDFFQRFARLAPTHLALFSTLCFLVLHLLNCDGFILILLGAGFLSVGLSHGALDHLTGQMPFENKHLPKHVLTYLSKAALLGILWIVAPGCALLAFILFSAWHFGQADFVEWKRKQGSNTLLWGLIVLSTILVNHYEETMDVLSHINGLHIRDSIFAISSSQVHWVAAALGMLSILFVATQKSKWMSWTLIYLWLCSQMPLLISFGIYFVIQHSMHGWGHLKKELKMESRTLWKQSMPYSLGGAFILTIFMSLQQVNYLGVFFILLACISMPHVLSMHHFYTRLRKKIASL
jgi:lycopene beta-cyclase